MTDGYSQGALDDLKKKIVHNAIKWTLQQEPIGWWGDADSGFYGQGWEGRLPPVSGPTGTVELKCFMGSGLSRVAGQPPGLKVAGSGTDGISPYYKYTVDPWADIYQPWIERIDSAFQGWDTLPDPAAFDGPIDQIRTAVQSLTPLPDDSGSGGSNGDFGDKYTSVDLSSDLDTVGKTLGSTLGEGGALVYAFQNTYGAARITGVMNNQAQAGIVLGVAMLGERKTMDGARKDIMTIASQAVDCFKFPGAGGDHISLEVVEAFADLLSDFAPPMLAKVITEGTKAVNLIDSLIPKKTEAPSVGIKGSTPDEVYTSLTEVIGKLNKQVFDQEFELAYTTLSGMVSVMRSHPASDFHINPDPGLDPQLIKAPTIDVKIYALYGIGHVNVPRIAAVMGRAANDVQGAEGSSKWLRDAHIGLGSNGPYDNWMELQGLFDSVTTGSAVELVEAGHRLVIGAGYLDTADGDTQKIMAGLQSVTSRGEDGWDNKPPPTGVYVNGRWVPF